MPKTKLSPTYRSIAIVTLLSVLVLGFVTAVSAPLSGAQARSSTDAVSPELAYLK